MMKQKLPRCLAILMLFSLCLSCWTICSYAGSGSDVAQKNTQSPAESYNKGAYEYQYNRWAKPIRSYLIKNSDGSMSRIEYTGSELVVERYSEDFVFLSRQDLPMELPVWGGFYEGTDSFFLAYGQTNPEEKDTVEVIRLVRYSKSWERLGAASIYGANTYIPFSGGSLRMVQEGTMLYVRTAHEMYKSSDGYHHQANMTFSISIPTMEVTASRHVVSNSSTGYVSHSFNQFLLADGNQLIALDHGDAYPRSMIMFAYTRSGAGQAFPIGSCKKTTILPIAGEIGANDTGAALGALQMSSTAYLAAGNSILQDGSVSTSGQRNIFVSVTPRGSVGGSNTTVKWITKFKDGQDNVKLSVPHMIPIKEDSFLLMWMEDKVLRYVFLNGSGDPVGKVYSCGFSLSDCVPMVYNNRVCWYVTENSQPMFLWIPLGAPDSPESSRGEIKVTLQAQGTELHGTVLLRKFGMYYGQLPTLSGKSHATFSGWFTSAQSPYYSATQVKADTYVSTLADHNLYAHWNITDHTCDYTEVLQSTPATCQSVARELRQCAYCYGTRTYYVGSYGPHTEVIDEGVAATCTEAGLSQGAHCSVCGKITVAQVEVPATGHKEVTKPAVAPSCTENGRTEEVYCSACNMVFTASQELPALGHSWVEASCVTAKHCSVCGTLEEATPSGYYRVMSLEELKDGDKIALVVYTGSDYKLMIDEISKKIDAIDVAVEGEKILAEELPLWSICREGEAYSLKTEGNGYLSYTGADSLISSHAPYLWKIRNNSKGEFFICDAGNNSCELYYVGEFYNYFEATTKNVGNLDYYYPTFMLFRYVPEQTPPGHTPQTVPGVTPSCRETGLSQGSICSVCGEILVEQRILPAFGHDFEDNVCQNCGLIDGARLISRSISLTGNIAINFYVEIEKTVLEDESAYFLFLFSDGTASEVPLHELETVTHQGKQCHRVSCEITAKEMTDEVELRFLYDEDQRMVYISTYSVKTYADMILSASKSPELLQLVISMLHYGAASQLYFEYNTDCLANEGLETVDYDGATIDGFPINREQGSTLVRFAGASLLLKSQTTLRLFFSVEPGGEGFSLSHEGELLPLQQRGELYYVDISDIPAYALDKTVELSLIDGTETATIRYCPLSYCASVLRNENGIYPNTLQDVAAALYLYYQGASSYFAQTQQ